MPKLYGEITGWGAYVPPRIVTNHELEATLDTTSEWIVQRTGIHQRHIADASETTSTMAVKASWSALAQANLPSTALDLILIATSSPDYFTPPVSSMVQAALNAHNTPAMTIVTGCTGFVYALVTAHQFIETGAYRNILVVGVELLSRFVDWEDRSTSVLFGDAGGAVVMQATEKPCGLQGYALGSDGNGFQHRRWNVIRQADDVLAGRRVSMGQPEGVVHGADGSNPVRDQRNAGVGRTRGRHIPAGQPALYQSVGFAGRSDAQAARSAGSSQAVQHRHGGDVGRIALSGA